MTGAAPIDTAVPATVSPIPPIVVATAAPAAAPAAAASVVCEPLGIGVCVFGWNDLNAAVFLVVSDSVRSVFLRDLLIHAPDSAVKNEKVTRRLGGSGLFQFFDCKPRGVGRRENNKIFVRGTSLEYLNVSHLLFCIDP